MDEAFAPREFRLSEEQRRRGRESMRRYRDRAQAQPQIAVKRHAWARRECLRCRRAFRSWGVENRMCDACRATAAWLALGCLRNW